MTNPIPSVRPSPIAGTWYSSNADRLTETIDTFLNQAELPPLPGQVVGLIAPHAGYQYSGAVAAYAFKTVLGKKFDYVAVLSPLHAFHPQPVLTTAHNAYQTPLGIIPVANDILDAIETRLQDRAGIGFTTVANDQEHSLEIELPFLQRALGGPFELIPIMLRSQSRSLTHQLGAALADVLRHHACLLVASSDLSHFYSDDQAHLLDQRVLKEVTNFSPNGLFDLLETGEGHACGLTAMAAVLWAAEALGADQATLLRYSTSAATTGDTSSVVGYASAVITRSD